MKRVDRNAQVHVWHVIVFGMQHVSRLQATPVWGTHIGINVRESEVEQNAEINVALAANVARLESQSLPRIRTASTRLSSPG
ncbi:MAG: hypothetical protein Q7L55_08955 [Actinomycetota bacterium]|nr:hypothetical protein [Actinomycetota bacterium]